MVRYSSILFAINQHIPLIKFRKGGIKSYLRSENVFGANVNAKPNAAIEDWQLPERYSRKPIDSVEMEYINNGGPL
ncbi:uncharacterized protein LOC118742235 [Rhagoletis pomonella]|uniref:uncharacterized protein LOC118742235 n=1 Tax=Rhagoletis pomonella TaxID=28610 RepID=UPI00177DA414|nr:uncharacterized protein LOC118742235 [Rhagoletis pomonella]